MSRKKKTIEEYKQTQKKQSAEIRKLKKSRLELCEFYKNCEQEQEAIIADQRKIINGHVQEVYKYQGMASKLHEVEAENKILTDRLLDIGLSNTATLEDIAKVMERITKKQIVQSTDKTPPFHWAM